MTSYKWTTDIYPIYHTSNYYIAKGTFQFNTYMSFSRYIVLPLYLRKQNRRIHIFKIWLSCPHHNFHFVLDFNIIFHSIHTNVDVISYPLYPSYIN